MASGIDVSIINLALIELGCEGIATRGEANTRARTMDAVFDICNQAVLEDHPWADSKKRIELSLLSSTPAFGWDYEYQLPADFVSIIPHEKEDDAFEYKIEGKKLLCNESGDAYIQYIADTDESENYSALHREALAMKLAVHACYMLTNSREREDVLIAKYLDVLARARTHSSRQSVAESVNGDTDMLDSDVWVNSRN